MSPTVPILISLAFGCAVEAPPRERRPPPPRAIEAEAASVACLGDPPCEEERVVVVEGTSVAYDHLEVTNRVRLAAMGEQSDVSVAVRLLLGEIGAERLLNNQHAQEEALAVLSTVHNRLDPAAWNPEGKPAQPWPGCETGSTFARCADPEQYLGLRAWRALHPAENVPSEQLEPAVEAAVAAWWALQSGLAEDPTAGATSFVHRCGAPAYGQPTTACDGLGDDDVQGANPATGPVVFRGPKSWDPDQGRYEMWRRHQVEYATR